MPTPEPKHPMQPFVRDKGGVVRFKANKIVSYMLDHLVELKALGSDGLDLNDIARLAARGMFSQDDEVQFAQLHGYSLKGFHELSAVPDAAARRASAAARAQGFDLQGCRDVGCEIHCGVEEDS